MHKVEDRFRRNPSRFFWPVAPSVVQRKARTLADSRRSPDFSVRDPMAVSERLPSTLSSDDGPPSLLLRPRTALEAGLTGCTGP
ncbi:unnamed protein product [Ixodes hexagonus]